MWKSKYNKILNIGAYNTILMNDPLCKESISVKKLYLDTSGDPIIIPQVAIMLTVICLQQIIQLFKKTWSWPGSKSAQHQTLWTLPARRLAARIQHQMRRGVRTGTYSNGREIAKYLSKN